MGRCLDYDRTCGIHVIVGLCAVWWSESPVKNCNTAVNLNIKNSRNTPVRRLMKDTSILLRINWLFRFYFHYSQIEWSNSHYLAERHYSNSAVMKMPCVPRGANIEMFYCSGCECDACRVLRLQHFPFKFRMWPECLSRLPMAFSVLDLLHLTW